HRQPGGAISRPEKLLEPSSHIKDVVGGVKTKVLNTTIDVLELAKVDDHLILLLKTFASLLLT
ncbi:MAG: hypothetical protein WBL92_02550, partial [Methanothrix sp.]